MDRKLTELKKLLRSERCPPSVIARITDQIKREPHQHHYHYLRWAPAGGLALAAIVLTLLLRKHPEPVVTAQQSEAAIVREQAVLSLAYFGEAFQHAGSQSRDIILEVTLPPLRQGLRKTKKVILPSE